MLCKNDQCRAPLHDSHWGEGYCSRRCMTSADDYERDAAPLMDPSDPTGHAEICRNRDEVDAMLAAAAIDPRLPRIIYMRRNGATLRRIAAVTPQLDKHGKPIPIGRKNPHVDKNTVTSILKNSPLNILRACGLHKI